MKQKYVLRLISLVSVFLIVLVFLVWNAGVISLPFLPSPLPGTEGTGAIVSSSDTDTGADTPSFSVTEQSTPPVTNLPPDTDPPQILPGAFFLPAKELAEKGYDYVQASFSPDRMLLAKVTLTEELSSLPGMYRTRTEALPIRVETQSAGIAIRYEDKTVPILSLTPYMGYVIAYAKEHCYLLNARGQVLREDLPELRFVYRRDADGRPIVMLGEDYYAIREDGLLSEIAYQPIKHTVRVDAPAPKVNEGLTPFAQIVPVFYLFDPEEDELEEGTVLYTQAQKEAILGGMSPEDALVQFPAVTEPSETVPGETNPSETVPSETEPSETNPGETAPGETGTETGESDAEGTGEESDPLLETSPLPLPAPMPSPETPAIPEEGQLTQSMTNAAETDPEVTDPEVTDPEVTDPEVTDPEVTDPEETEPKPEPEPVDLYRLAYESRYGYKDAEGTVVIAPTFTYAFPFGENGLAAVTIYTEAVETSTLCFINRAGEIEIGVSGKILWDFTVNDSPVYDGYYLSLTDGEPDIGSYYFDHGYVRVRRRTVLRSNIGRAYSDEDILIDEDGKHFPIPEGYALRGYSDGILLLEKGGKFGYMNIHGSWIAQPIYDAASPFYSGLAVLTVGGKQGMIDTAGNFVLPPEYQYISNSSFGTVTAYKPQSGWVMLCTMEQASED